MKLLISIFTLCTLALAACSSKKYDSWSECMLEEPKSTSSSSKLIVVYCNSNYTPAPLEKQTYDRVFGLTDNPTEINEADAAEVDLGNEGEAKDFEAVAKKFGGRSIDRDH